MMHAVLLVAALAAGLVPWTRIELPDQAAVPNADLAGHASVAFPPQWLPKDKIPHLRENGSGVPLQLQVRATWPDGSAKWAHLRAHWKYSGGKPATYTLHPVDPFPHMATPAPPPLPAAGELSALPRVVYCSDDWGRTFVSGPQTISKLENGPIATVYQISGEMLGSLDSGPVNDPNRTLKIQPFLTYNTWVTIYSNRIDVEHAYTITSDMRAVRISELGIRVTAPEGWGCYLRDAGKRLPHAIKQTGREVDVQLWPKGGVPRIPTVDRNLHKFEWLNSGEVLDFNTPPEVEQLVKSLYKLRAGSSIEYSEITPSDLRTSTPEGISIVTHFSLVKLEAGQSQDDWRALLQRKIVPKPPGAWFCDAGVLGRVAPRSKKYAAVEQMLEAAHISFHNPDKVGTNGWTNYGNQPERIDATGRVIQHRSCSTYHYWNFPMWQQIYRGADDPALLDAARRATAHLSAFGVCRSSGKRLDGYPATRSKNLYAFYHGKNIFPWGTTEYGMRWPDVECWKTGHWPDPAALEFSFLHDCNWFDKQGFDGWANGVDLRDKSQGREPIGNMMQAVWAWRFTGEQRFLDGAKLLAATLIKTPLEKVTEPGPLANPIWPMVANEILDTPASRQYVLDNAKWAFTQPANWHVQGTSSLALLAEAARLDPSLRQPTETYLPRPFLVNPNDTIVLGPGGLGERAETVSWPYTLWALPDLEK